jgi:RimJ/RimL family protein N-acetyltransferase
MIHTGLLKGERIRLTAINEDDALAISKWYSDIDFLRYFDKVPAIPKTERQLREWIVKVQDSNSDISMAIRNYESEAIIGYAELSNIQWSNGTATLGIGIGDNSKQGRGCGKETIKLLLDYAFKELNLHRVQLNVLSYNEKAIGLYEKMGFMKEGIYREFISKDGKRWDMYLYGILKHEWLNL